jgi:hypothetical protein
MYLQNKIPRSVEIIKEQMAELVKVKATQDQDASNDFSYKLFLESINCQEEKLKEELKTAEWLESKFDIELVFDGSSVKDYLVTETLLSTFLLKSQRLLIATAEFVSCHKISERDYFTDNIISENQLFFNSFKPFSFGIEFKYADYLKNLSNDLSNLNSDKHFEPLFMSLLSGNDDFKDLSCISKSRKLLFYYDDLLCFLEENDVAISGRTKTHPFNIKMTTDTIKKRRQFVFGIMQSHKREKVKNK